MNSTDGQQFYMNLIQALRSAGISIIADLIHYDLPQRLDDDTEKLREEYLDYAKLCFDMFGEFVGHWITHASPLPEVRLLLPYFC